MTKREPAQVLARLRAGKQGKEPGKLAQAINGIQVIGFRKSLQTVLCTAQKAWWERRHAPPAPVWGSRGVGPGRMLKLEPDPPHCRARFEHAELDVRWLASDLVRITWHPGADPVPYAIAREQWPSFEPGGFGVGIEEDGSLVFRVEDRLLRRDLPPVRHGTGWCHRAVLHPDEQVHGLGERALPFDLRGTTSTMWNSEPGGHYTVGHDPIYLCTPTYVGVHTEGS